MRKNEKTIIIFTLLSSFILFTLLAGMYFHKLSEKNEGEAQEQQTKPQEFGETENGTEEVNETGIHDSEINIGAAETDMTEQEKLDSETVDVVEENDFADTLFVGDSRTIGLMEYGNIEHATFFADKGMSVFRLEKKQVPVPDLGKVSFYELLEKKKFSKIYFMLGMNELGYPFESIEKKYQEVLSNIIEKQEGAVIYLCANLHVTAEQSQKDEIYNNVNINRVNEMIASLADNETTFYIDVNELFDDENGCLSSEYASDHFHVWGKYYADWVEWLRGK